jgi:pimeloyl-ACP methyl ester carboxylesterase
MTISRTAWIAGGSRRRLAGIDHEIFVRYDGPVDGRPVTLLHGFPTWSHDWAAVLPFLTDAGFRVTTLDFLGFGESDKPRRYAYSLLEQADIVEALWAEDGITATALVAHDYGVSVAQELLARDPSRITAMVWLNGGLFPDLHRPTKGQSLLHGRFGPLAARLMTSSRFATSLREVLGRPVSDADLADMWKAVSTRRGTLVVPALLRYIDERPQHAERWATAMSTYPGQQSFIWGPADPVSGAHVLPRIREVVPGAVITVLDSPTPVGHYPQVEDPARVGPLLVAGLAHG